MPHHTTTRRLLTTLIVGTAVATLHQPDASAQRVLMIMVDGLRPDAMQAANTPVLDALMANGTFSLNATTSDLTFSGPGQSDFGYGVHRDVHGVTTNGTSDNPNEADAQFQIYSGSNMGTTPDLLAIANTANPALQTARFTGAWNPAHTTRSPAGSEYTFVGSDAAAAADVAAYYANNANNAHVSYLYLAEPDYAGHSNGFHPNSTNYKNQIAATDAEIGSVISAIQGRTNFVAEDWVFILGSDHGGNSGGGHGGNAAWQREVPLIVSGNSVSNGELGYDAKNVDAVATALAHLGIAASANLAGHAIGLSGVADPRPTIGLGHNLIFNGDAEHDQGFTDHAMDQALTGWNEFRDANFITESATRTGSQTATVLQYGTPGDFPTTGDEGPADRGTNFFSAGANSGSIGSESFQRIDVSALAAQIDAGDIDFDLSAWLGGFAAQDDHADFEAQFIAADGSTVLGSVLLAGPDAAERGDTTKLIQRTANGDVAAGTRHIEVILTTDGNDGYADNLSLTLVPEPTTLALLTLAGPALLRRRRGQR